jgi:hypothetical protein
MATVIISPIGRSLFSGRPASERHHKILVPIVSGYAARGLKVADKQRVRLQLCQIPVDLVYFRRKNKKLKGLNLQG